MKDSQHNQTINYSGVFLSCFFDLEERCFHAMPEHALCYLYAGEQTVIDRDKKYTIQAGESVFIRRNHQTELIKSSKNEHAYKGITLRFNREILKDVYKKTKKRVFLHPIISEEKILTIQTTPEITSLFQSLTPYFDENRQPNDRIVYSKLMEAIYALLEQSDVFFPILFDFVDPWKIDILDFLNLHYMDDLSIEQIATYTGRSLATFKRDFKKISTLSPQKWLINKRLEEAYQQLQRNEKIQDVCVAVGFKNLAHFSTSFKKKYGISPSKIAL